MVMGNLTKIVRQKFPGSIIFFPGISHEGSHMEKTIITKRNMYSMFRCLVPGSTVARTGNYGQNLMKRLQNFQGYDETL